MGAIPSKLRSATAGVLSGSAKVLSLSSQLLEAASGLLRPTQPEGGDRDTDRRSQGEPRARRHRLRADDGPGPVSSTAEDTDEAGGRVATPPTEPVAGVAEHVRTSETHVGELAAKPAAEVIQAVADLSTDELQRLYSHEQRNKKRKTVLQAIERSLSPGAGQGNP